MEGGKAVKRGVPQGGVVSPMLANLYMNRFLKHWRGSGRDEAFRARVVNYADDFVILSRGKAAEALECTDRVMTRLGLTLNRTKTRLCDARKEQFDFLGYSFGAHFFPADRTAISRRQSLQEERATSQGQGERYARPRQCRPLGRGAKASQPPLARLGRLLQLRDLHACL